MNIKVVHADDWAGLYVDGLLYREGHRIEPSDICSAIIKFDSQRNLSFDEKWIYQETDDEFDFPVHYEDLNINNSN